MANWTRKLNLKDVWESADLALISRTAAQRLKNMRPLEDSDLDEERQDFAEEFESLSEDPDTTVSDFDDTMRRLYDWADTPLDSKWNGKKVCWVETSF